MGDAMNFTPPVLNRKLILETEERVGDGAGGWTTAWKALGDVWASVDSRYGREIEEGGRQYSRVTHRIIVRGATFGATSRPRADQRFREGARVFFIRGVAEADLRGRYLVCWADEEASQ
jgi:SPP1 family predicted phage head-tail adaptor